MINFLIITYDFLIEYPYKISFPSKFEITSIFHLLKTIAMIHSCQFKIKHTAIVIIIYFFHHFRCSLRNSN